MNGKHKIKKYMGSAIVGKSPNEYLVLRFELDNEDILNIRADCITYIETIQRSN